MRKRRFLGYMVRLALVLSLVLALGMTALAEGQESQSTYTIIIPAELTVNQSGWNSAGSIIATGTLAEGAKLTVTATSGEDGFALKCGDSTIGYKLAGSEVGEEKTEWVFETLDQTQAQNQGVGIKVDDYSEKSGGIYTDTVTFTASARTITINGVVLSYVDGDKWAKVVERNSDILEFVESENHKYIQRKGTNQRLRYQNSDVQSSDTVYTNYLTNYFWVGQK